MNYGHYNHNITLAEFIIKQKVRRKTMNNKEISNKTIILHIKNEDI